ncbi:putative LPS assembly protein LptD [Zhouia sp. PK063]|uniref:putative LPS assembly protein LptD n=1 Tax=Zhouia sp. PK063 TaxID=3373602 RepID=UPI00379955F7
MALRKSYQIYAKIGFKALQANKPYILLIFVFFIWGMAVNAQDRPKKTPLNLEFKKDSLIKKTDSIPGTVLQDTTKTDSTAADSLKQKPFLLDVITYSADSIPMSRKDHRIYMYNNAEVQYQDYDLKAGTIIIDYTTNEVYAGRIKDSTGSYTQTPDFKQGSQEVKPDSIRFNFDTKRAIIINSRSEQNLGEAFNVFAEKTKKENDSVYFMKEAKLTTSETPDDPDYYIRIRKGKFVPGKKVIASFSNLYLANVPTPIAVPFAYFPMTETRTSGFIMPTPGQNNQRGYFIQNGGYYFAASEYFDLALTGDYYTNGSYGLRAESSYKKRYKFNGSFRIRYENLVNSQKGFDDYSRSSIYNIQWSHSQDSKSSPNSRFSASVNLGSSQYYQESVNQLNTSNFLNNTLSSSVSYSKTFPEYPSLNLSLTARVSQNTQTQSVDATLPSLQANLERIYPFASKDGAKKGIFQNINFQYSMSADNQINTTDSLFFTSKMFEDAKFGVKHTVPISTNFKLFKYLSTTVSGTYNDVWQLQTIRENNYDPITGLQTRDTLSGFDRYGTYNLSASIGTTIYGTFRFGDNHKIQAIRHVMRPSVSYGYTPGFDQYYDEYIADEKGTTVEYSRFENGIYGAPSIGNSNNVSFSLSNTLEAKVRDDKDSTATEAKKITLLNSFNLNTSYNIVADSLKWSPLRITGGTQLLKNKMSVNFGTTLDPYAIDNNGRRINTFNINNGGSLFRMTNANVNVSYSLNSKSFSGDGDDKDETDNTASGGRNDDLFGKSQDFSDSRTMNNENTKDKNTPTKYYANELPWDLQFAYSLTYSNSNRQNEITTNSLMFSGNVDLTEKWKVGVSSGYDFKEKGFTYTQLRFQRDMNSFRLNFNYVPFSSRSSWYFFIGIKSSILSDLKWEKRSEPSRSF